MRRMLAVCALLAAACSANETSMIRIGSRAAPADLTTCSFDPGGKSLLDPGVLDVAAASAVGLAPSYRLVVYVSNNLADPAVTNPANLKSSKAWHAYSARVRVDPKSYVDAFGPNPPLPATQEGNVTPLTGQSIDPGGGTGTIEIEAIGASLGTQLAPLVGGVQGQTVVLGITLEGQTGDGASLDSGEWFFPVRLCSGCLAAPTCPAGQVLKTTNCFASWQDSAPVCAAP